MRTVESDIRTLVIAALLIASLGYAVKVQSASALDALSPGEARAIAKEAYVYGFPMVDSYRIQYDYFTDTKNPEFKAPWNQIANIPRVTTPADTTAQTPNADTPYSWLGLDLRAQPIVLTMPVIPKERYFTVQLIDAYTFNFDYIGSRVTGNDGGTFLIAGPGWKGTAPAGITKVIHADTDFIFAFYRVQLFNPNDLDNVKKVQAGFKVQTLSAFTGSPAVTAPPVDFIKPISRADQKTSLQFFNILNFILQYCPTDPSEVDLMARFAKIGVGAGKTIDIKALSPEIRTAMEQGMADGWADFNNVFAQFNQGKVQSGDVFGTRAYLKNNYSYRMAAAVLGIYGNSKEEAMYPLYGVDSTGQKLTGADKYTLHFANGQLPPVHAFWSLTMYKMPESLLVANPINRYLINSPMLPDLKKDADGGLTIYVQHDSPGKNKEANWLPAPTGPFMMYLRLYWPKDAALDGQWTAPKVDRVQ
jgi:hypothetical protein